jgi:DNA-binding response OmpR family regulator
MGRVLVVDDEKSICTSVRDYLERWGYEVFTAISGLEGIRLVKQERPHVVLLDIKMPEPNGLTVLRMIKKFDPRTMVIMLTALRDREVVAEAMDLGADGYITKPIDPEYLKDVVYAKMVMFMV